MRLVRTFLFFFFTVLLIKSLFAQPEHYKFAHLDINGGLSHNQVRCFLKDKNGFLWIGTEAGLNRFDGYTVHKYFNDSQDSTSIRSNGIVSLFELPEGHMGVLTVEGLSIYDPQRDAFLNGSPSYFKNMQIQPDSIKDVIKNADNMFWFIPKSRGVFLYDEKSKTSTCFKNDPADTTSIVSSAVTCITQVNNGSYWIAHDDGIIEHAALSGKSLKVTYRNYLLRSDRRFAFDINMVADGDDDLWIYLLNDNRGIYFFDSKLKKARHIYKESPGMHLNANIVASVTVGDDGLIWVATDHGGINLINKKSGQTMIVSHHDEDQRSLAQNSITTLYKDEEGIIWIGTYKHGLNYYHKNIIRFPLYQHYPLDLKGLPFGDVNRFVEDKKGNLWLGTNGGGLIYFDREKNTFNQFKNNPNDPSSLSSDVIVSLLMDENDILWIGTYYGGLNSFDGKKFKRFMPVQKDPSSISSRSVWEIFEDSHHRLWIGTLDGGLELMDRKTNTFTHYRSGDVNSVRSTYISAIMEDKNGNLWFGTGRGIDILMRETGRFIHYENEKKNPKSLSSNTILDLKEASDGKIWIATLTGLNMFDVKTKTFSLFRESDGLPSNSVLTILEDNQKNLWFATTNGISKMTLTNEGGHKKYIFQNFDEDDGLQGKQFNENASLKTKNDELIFGGSNGFNVFRPEQLGVNKEPPQIVLTDFQLFTKSVKPGEKIDGRIILNKSIVNCDEVVLPANENVFSIEFAALNFFHPEKNDYKYNLEGFSTDWLTADSKSRKITFTNLNPGNYIFHVKAANNDGIWNDKGASLKITVLPPFWKTNTAFAAYVLFIIGALLLTRKLIQQREQMKFVIRQERQEALRMHELDMMKIKFFTNVSHEFRTPLTLILTPLEKLLKHVSDHDQQNQFLLIQRNAKRLLNLVNQLLDFRKMEVQELRFNPSEGDIIAFLKETVSSFSDLSEKKHIQLQFESSIASLETLFDQDKLEKILFNLLSNAFKFTPDHGAVSVKVTLLESKGEKYLQVMVRDTGIGITPEKQERIFERFFQNELPKSMVNQGSGIGLSITKEFVRIMNGTITVESELEKGSVFIVELPVKEVFTMTTTQEATQAVLPEPSKINSEIANGRTVTSDSKKPILLLVEDNEDFRFYLKDNLRDSYHVIEAKDGLDGWQKIIEYLPDLMVSDVMMPHMNGIELTRKVKSDKRVSHIPIILLTARTAEEQKLEGFEAGTDEYLTKPFNFEILVSRIRNLILQREKFQKSFSKQLDVKASELNITSVDEKFIKDAIRCVEENIESTEFSVEDLSRELAISRAHLYKKIHALTGKSPLEFMRVIRLQQAAQLLERSQLTVAEVAYKVGFNNPKYFARYFKDEFGTLPSLYAASKRENK